MKKICVITGTRAEYGLLYWLMKGIEAEPSLHLQVIVTGMHLSPEFGLTYKEIEKEFSIDKKIEILLSSDTSIGVSKSLGLSIISFSECYNDLRPDLLIVLGDRFEIFGAVSAAMISRIPVAHIHGGEATEGVIDESIRHSITKMSHLHFTSTEEYKDRVTQLGEQPEKVFNVGALGIDNIKKLQLLDKKEFEDKINFKLKTRMIIVTFHPVTLENNSSRDQFKELLSSLDKIDDVSLIFTKANSDMDGRVINEMIDEYVLNNRSKSISFFSMGQLLYLSGLSHADLVIGNSSSGILEAPSFAIPTINIGDRQRGRIQAESVIDCEPSERAISIAIERALSDEFKGKINNVVSPYGEGGASQKIVNILKSVDFTNLLKKKFYDIR